jgi:hypothetical protein
MTQYLYMYTGVANYRFQSEHRVVELGSIFLPRDATPDKLYHIMLYTSQELSFKLTTSVVIGTDWIGSCKSNYHTRLSLAATS